MACRIITTIAYKLHRTKLVRQLLKAAAEPDTYIAIYKKLEDLYIDYKNHNKYTPEQIISQLDAHIVKKGLKPLKDLEEELRRNKEIDEEQQRAINRLLTETDDLYKLVAELQDLQLKNREDIDNLSITMKTPIGKRILNRRRIHSIATTEKLEPIKDTVEEIVEEDIVEKN